MATTVKPITSPNAISTFEREQGPDRPSADIRAKQDPQHNETEFLHDLEKATQRVEPGEPG